MSEKTDNQSSEIIEQAEVPTIEGSNSMGDIKINHSVVASIVRLSALEIEGVFAVGGGLVDGIREIFKGRESDHGVRVAEDQAGQYEIEVRVEMRFGVELAKVALRVQERVQEQVKRMTMKEVGRVDVIIDGIRMGDEEVVETGEKDNWLEESSN